MHNALSWEHGEAHGSRQTVLTEQVPINPPRRIQRVEVDAVVKLLLGVVEQLQETRGAIRPAYIPFQSAGCSL